MSRVLVTGASGFLGHWAARALAQAGHETHGATRNIRETSLGFEIAFHQADALDSGRIETLIDDLRPTHLLLSAWITVPGAYWNDPANEQWSGASVAAARVFWRRGGQRVVLVGTCAEYDWRDPVLGEGALKETDAQGEPHTIYGRAKRNAAAALAALSREYGGSFANARIFFPVGVGEQKEKFLPTIIRSLIAGTPCALGPCDYIRDIIDVRDAGAALAALVESAVIGPVNVGSGKGILLSDIANSAGAMLGRPELIRIGALAARQEDPPMLVADTRRLAAETRFRAIHSIDRTVSDAIAYWRNSRT